VIPLLRFLDRLERKAPPMTIDPALAHLYGDALAEDDLELEELKAAAARKTSLEELTLEQDVDDDELDEHDLEELAILVEAKIADGTFSYEEAAELGLGEIRDLDDGDRELVLNETGRAVVVRAALRRTSALGGLGS
jgi:hypothetical protein